MDVYTIKWMTSLPTSTMMWYPAEKLIILPWYTMKESYEAIHSWFYYTSVFNISGKQHNEVT